MSLFKTFSSHICVAVSKVNVCSEIIFKSLMVIVILTKQMQSNSWSKEV